MGVQDDVEWRLSMSSRARTFRAASLWFSFTVMPGNCLSISHILCYFFTLSVGKKIPVFLSIKHADVVILKSYFMSVFSLLMLTDFLDVVIVYAALLNLCVI